MKFLTIVGVILATTQSLLAQEVIRQVCCDTMVTEVDGSPTGIGCVPLTPNCVQSERYSGICSLFPSGIGRLCRDIEHPEH
jgi:hypothetical protein